MHMRKWSYMETLHRSEPKDVTIVESGSGDVHIFADSVEDRDFQVHRHFIRSAKGASSVATLDPKLKKASVKSYAS